MNPADRTTEVVNVLNDIETLRRFRRLYPHNHPALPAVRERLREHALGLAGEEPASFGIAPDGFLWHGETLPLSKGSPAMRLLAYLFQLGLAAVGLTFPDAGDGLVAFAEHLASLKDPPGEADRERILSAQPDMPGVELVAIDIRDMRLVDESATGETGGSGVVWGQVLVEMVRRGTLARFGVGPGAEVTPRDIVELLSSESDVEPVLDFLFAQLAEAVLTPAVGRPPLRTDHVRTFLDELLGLLDPERRCLAVVCASRHLALDTRVGPKRSPLVGLEIVLAAGEYLLGRGVAAPEQLVELIGRIVESGQLHDLASPETRARAAALLARFDARAGARPESIAAPRALDVRPDWNGTPWARGLAESLTDLAIRRHLVQVFAEVSTLWPDAQVADLAAERLTDDMIDTVELGDFELATRLARMLAVTRNQAARKLAASLGVRAAVKAYKVFDPQQHAAIGGLLAALGDSALPELLGALAEAEDMVSRKRLLGVIIAFGAPAIPQVRPLLDDPRWYVVRNGLFLLRRLNDPALVEMAGRRIPGAAPQVLAEILKALVVSRDPGWLEAILHELDGPDEKRARAALSVAARVPHPDLSAALVQRLLERIGRRLREPLTLDMIGALRRIHDPSAFDALERIVHLHQWRYPFSLSSIRAEAAAAIAAIGTPAARRLADELGRDRDPEVARAARAVQPRRDEPLEDEP
jgi:hypothetical protein